MPEFMNVAALAELIGASHVIDENTLSNIVRLRIHTLTRMIAYEQMKADERAAEGKSTFIMRREISALRYALRVLTHPSVQVVANECDEVNA